MRIVILKRTLGQKGGLEKHAHRIAQGFIDRGCDITFLTSDRPGSDFPYPYVSFPTPKWPLFWSLEKFDRSVRNFPTVDRILGLERNRFQTHLRAGSGVHAAYLKMRSLSSPLSHLLRKIHPLHHKILELEKVGFENRGLQKIFTNSHMVKAEILHYYKPTASIEVIHNGVEWEEMIPGFSEWEKGYHPHSRFHFLFVGNGFFRKGLDILLRALALLKRRDFFLSIVGKEKKTDFFMRLVEKLNIQKNVRFFGPQKSLTSFYQWADALVIPSWYDPFANVTIEALAMGVFVISSKHNGGHEILTPQTGSILSDLSDIDHIADQLEKAMSVPKTPLSSNLIRNSVKHLDFSIQMTKLIDQCL